jgi:Raf kinase inhibitor-like YbhB/YbcL family protein
MYASFKLLGLIIMVGVTSFSGVRQLTVTSAAFTNNGAIPAKYTCEGAGISPPVHITGAPAGTKSLALIVHDPDAAKKGGFTHWVVWNIDIKGDIPEDFKGADQGLNGSNKPGYKGMCPPSGTHHYHFMVYALNANLRLNPNTDKQGLESAMRGHILAEGELIV